MSRRRRPPQEVWTLDRVSHPMLPLAIAEDWEGRLCAVSLGADLSWVRELARRHGVDMEPARARGQAHHQLSEYLRGEREAFDLKLRFLGTPFQRQAWSVLRTVGFGELCTYAELARRMGRPGAARAVGHANRQNLLPIVVPCHRVVGADGSLTGFRGGLPVKRWLLEHESNHRGPRPWVSAAGSQLSLH